MTASDPDTRLPPTAAAARAVLLAAAAALAAATPLFHGAHVAGIPFRLVAPVAAVASLGAAGFVLLRGLRGLGPGLRAERREAVALALLAAGMGLLLLLVQHATSDDSTYLPPVVLCLAHPDRVPGYLGFLWLGDPAPPLPRFALPVPFDFLQGVVAHFTGAPLLTLRYLAAPPLLAALLPLSWFLLLARLGLGTRAAVAGTLLGGAALLLMREEQGAPGCAFVLLVYQAKFFAPAVLLPLFAAEGLGFLRSPGPRPWIALAVIATASAGASLSSVVLQCLLAPALAVAGAFAFPGAWRRALLLLPAVAYPGLVAMWIHGDARTFLAPSSPIFGEPALPGEGARPYGGFLLHVLGGSLTAPLAAAGLLLAIAGLTGWARRFLIGWTAAVFLLYINPVMGPLVVEHVTSSDIHWRLCFLLPLPLALGVPGAALVERLQRAGRVRPTLPVVLAAGIALLVQLPAQASGLYDSLQLVRPFPDPDRCLNRIVAADARWIVAAAPTGPLLAPQYVSTIVPMMGPDHPPLVHWAGAVLLGTDVAGLREEGPLRLAAGNSLQGGGAADAAALGELLRRRPEVRNVLASAEGLARHGVATLLEDRGFRLAGTSPSGLRLLVRP